MSIEMAREAAARGAAFLDEKDDGWRDRVNRAELDMREPCGCVVGQSNSRRYDLAWQAHGGEPIMDDLSDPYAFGLEYLGVESYDDHACWENETRLGFIASVVEDGVPDGTSWRELQTAWEEILGLVEVAS